MTGHHLRFLGVLSVTVSGTILRASGIDCNFGDFHAPLACQFALKPTLGFIRMLVS
jgi:hypothetical protein